MPPHAGEDVARKLVAFLGQPDEPVSVSRRPERLLRQVRRGEAGDVRLEMAAPGARPLARHAVEDDHDVPELGPAAEELPVDDGTAAAAGAEGEHDHRPRGASRAEVELGVGGGVRVVLDADGQAEPLGHVGPEVDLGAERDVHRLQGTAGSLVDR